MARICGIEAGMSALVIEQASQLRRENRERSGMLKASASGITARTVLASLSTSAALRGTSSTEILTGSPESAHFIVRRSVAVQPQASGSADLRCLARKILDLAIRTLQQIELSHMGRARIHLGKPSQN